VDELRALGPEDLAALFGAMGRLIYHRARGRDPAPIDAPHAPRTISRETSFHRDTIDRREVEGMLHYLTERAMRAARQLGLAARTVEIGVGLAAGEHRRRARTLRAPTTSDAAAYAAALILLGELWPRRDRLHRVGVTLSGFTPASALQSDLFAAGRRDEPEYYRGLDRVRDRFGHASVVAGRSLELLGRLEQDRYGFVLRTPSLTK
jgi:DNA polymerase-4